MFFFVMKINIIINMVGDILNLFSCNVANILSRNTVIDCRYFSLSEILHTKKF